MGQLFMAILTLLAISVETITIYDTERGDIYKLFESEKAKYVIRYAHQFTDTLRVPYGCELMFEGGSLSGPIVFNETKLSGGVKLKGSVISGTIKNKEFDASWLCAMDGVSDDAGCINEMIKVCGNVFFPSGAYRLISAYDANDIGDEYQKSVIAHIGIHRSDVSLIGESGTFFVTDEPLGTMCVFSLPNEIEKSIRNIRIENITFKVYNDAIVFHELMHTIKIIGVNGITITNCTFNDFWGDAICLSHYGDDPNTGERTRNQNIKILNNKIIGGEHYNNRNGISIINGKNVLIKNNLIKNTSRENMPGGIDVEPNNSAYTIENIRIESNTIEGVRGNMGAIGIVLPQAGAPAYGVSIINNKISNCSWGISVCITTEMTSSNIQIVGNYIADDTNPYNFGGKGASKDWIIKNNYFGKPRNQKIPGDIKVDNLVVKKNKKKD